jgi:hypothetical protein
MISNKPSARKSASLLGHYNIISAATLPENQSDHRSSGEDVAAVLLKL